MGVERRRTKETMEGQWPRGAEEENEDLRVLRRGDRGENGDLSARSAQKQVEIYGRTCLIYDCDDFTKAWYMKNMGLDQCPLKLAKGRKNVTY